MRDAGPPRCRRVSWLLLVTGVLAVIFNLIADLLYSALDPRIRVN